MVWFRTLQGEIEAPAPEVVNLSNSLHRQEDLPHTIVVKTLPKKLNIIIFTPKLTGIQWRQNTVQ
jgi:hypothetical protein